MIGKLCNRIFSFITAHKQGYVFTPVCHSGCLPQCMLGYTPQEQTPPLGADTPSAQCMLGDTGNKRAVRILLECILVESSFIS